MNNVRHLREWQPLDLCWTLSVVKQCLFQVHLFFLYILLHYSFIGNCSLTSSCNRRWPLDFSHKFLFSFAFPIVQNVASAFTVTLTIQVLSWRSSCSAFSCLEEHLMLAPESWVFFCLTTFTAHIPFSSLGKEIISFSPSHLFDSCSVATCEYKSFFTVTGEYANLNSEKS